VKIFQAVAGSRDAPRAKGWKEIARLSTVFSADCRTRVQPLWALLGVSAAISVPIMHQHVGMATSSRPTGKHEDIRISRVSTPPAFSLHAAQRTSTDALWLHRRILLAISTPFVSLHLMLYQFWLETAVRPNPSFFLPVSAYTPLDVPSYSFRRMCFTVHGRA
jgi:hypothetical protein